VDYAGIFDDSIQHAGPSGNGDLDLAPPVGLGIGAGLKTIANNANVRTTDVTAGGGTSSTILLGHKVMRPEDYGNPAGPNDTGGWASVSTNSSYDHMRWSDSNSSTLHGYIRDITGTDVNHMGGPHAMGAPVLYADGSVHFYPYLYSDPLTGVSDDATWQLLWAYNRVTVVEAP
jgi:hypothetical protein